MKKLCFVFLLLLLSACFKNPTQPDPQPTATPVPQVAPEVVIAQPAPVSTATPTFTTTRTPVPPQEWKITVTDLITMKQNNINVYNYSCDLNTLNVIKTFIQFNSGPEHELDYYDGAHVTIFRSNVFTAGVQFLWNTWDWFTPGDTITLIVREY
jgi:hypothetical protein